MQPFGIDYQAIQAVPFADMVRGIKPSESGERQQGRRAFLTRTNRRRFACLRAAADALTLLPQDEGEALHGIMTGFYDLMHLLIVLLQRLGAPCDTMRLATLSLSRRNVQEMAALLDSGSVRRIDLLTSDFFYKHDEEIFAELLKEFSLRGQRVAAARSHCKIVALALDDGRRYVLHGSPNLRTNKNAEQFCLERSADLFGFYDTWLNEMVTANEVKPSGCSATG
jgi:hypothetical protein